MTDQYIRELKSHAVSYSTFEQLLISNVSYACTRDKLLNCGMLSSKSTAEHRALVIRISVSSKDML